MINLNNLVYYQHLRIEITQYILKKNVVCSLHFTPGLEPAVIGMQFKLTVFFSVAQQFMYYTLHSVGILGKPFFTQIHVYGIGKFNPVLHPREEQNIRNQMLHAWKLQIRTRLLVAHFSQTQTFIKQMPLTTRPWAKCGSCSAQGLLCFLVLSVTRCRPPLGQIMVRTLNHPTCKVYSPKAVETLIHGKCQRSCFLIVCKIYFLLVFSKHWI